MPATSIAVFTRLCSTLAHLIYRGPLKVLDAVAFLEAYGLLDAARFLLPLAPPKSGRESEVMELPDLLLKVSV